MLVLHLLHSPCSRCTCSCCVALAHVALAHVALTHTAMVVGMVVAMVVVVMVTVVVDSAFNVCIIEFVRMCMRARVCNVCACVCIYV